MNKKVLFFTYDFPYPANSGGKTRAYNLLKFASYGFDVALFSFVRADFKQEYFSELKKIGVSSITTFNRPPVKSLKNLLSIAHPNYSIFRFLYFDCAIEKQLLKFVKENKIDIVHFESFYTSFYISESLRALGVKQIYGTENIEHAIYEDYVKKIFPLLRFPFNAQLNKIKKEEVEFAKRADITVAVTVDESHYFQNNGAKKISVIPNGVDINEFAFRQHTRPEGHKLLFVGNFSYFPNRDGIMFFYNEILPRLKENYHLTIIGRGAKTLKINNSMATCIEFVKDIKDAYYAADVFVSPIRIGGGTNFKVIEAMACGTPVIMHSSRVASLGLTPGENVIAASGAEEFAEKLEILLLNDALRGKITKAARHYIEKNYSWDKIGKKLQKVWDEV